MKCMIMAGGFGTRLYPLTQYKAKALLEYRGKPALTHLVHCVPAECDVFVSINKKFTDDFLAWRLENGLPLEFCIEDSASNESKKGAISSLHYWIRKLAIATDLLVIAGDNYFNFDLSQFTASFDGSTPMVAVHDIKDYQKASQFGVVQLDGKGILTQLIEKPQQAASTLIATACYILPPRVFPLLDEYCQAERRDNLGEFVSFLIERDKVAAYVFNDFWCDIGSEH